MHAADGGRELRADLAGLVAQGDDVVERLAATSSRCRGRWAEMSMPYSLAQHADGVGVQAGLGGCPRCHVDAPPAAVAQQGLGDR